MEQAVLEGSAKAEARKEHDVAVAVITPSGIFPDDDDYRRVKETTVIAKVLEEAAKKLKITNTSDWVARVHDREIDTHRTFHEDHLSGIVEIEWHKHEGGGGA
jgi:predicted nucleotidyltransferase